MTSERVAVDALARAYFATKARVIAAGFDWEIDEAERRLRHRPDEEEFLREIAWVILCSGMRATVVEAKFAAISQAFLNWRSAALITRRRKQCAAAALQSFNHPGKVMAIVDAASQIADQGFDAVMAQCDQLPQEYQERFSYIGPITSYHLAKNLGMDVAKPDRHLVRIAASVGWEDPVDFCRELGSRIAEPQAIVDTVLWRYATLNRGYLGEWQALVKQSLALTRTSVQGGQSSDLGPRPPIRRHRASLVMARPPRR